MRVAEFADSAGVTRQTVYNWIKTGEVKLMDKNSVDVQLYLRERARIKSDYLPITKFAQAYKRRNRKDKTKRKGEETGVTQPRISHMVKAGKIKVEVKFGKRYIHKRYLYVSKWVR